MKLDSKTPYIRHTMQFFEFAKLGTYWYSKQVISVIYLGKVNGIEQKFYINASCRTLSDLQNHLDYLLEKLNLYVSMFSSTDLKFLVWMAPLYTYRFTFWFPILIVLKIQYAGCPI